MRIRTHHLVAAVAATAILIVSGAAFAAQGDCSQPVSSGTNPTASDCLFILKAAVGAVQCTLGTPPGCVCKPTGGDRLVATDALLCLKKAVGQGVTLNCPCGGPKCSSGKLVSVAGTKLDSGWNGIAHDTDLIEGASVTFEVVRRCSNDSSVCKIDTDCTGGATCDLTCDCDSQNDTVCEISGPTHEQRCLVSLALCNSNADCAGAAGGECVRFFGPPLGLSAGGTPACVTSVFASPITGTADSKTGEGVASSFLRSRVHLGITRDKPCPRCGAPSASPQVGDSFTCDGGPNNGNSCTVHAVSPDFGGASSDCPLDVTANVSGGGLAIRFNEVSTRTVSAQANIPCGGQNGGLFPGPGGGFCLDVFSSCSTNADCTRCKADPTTTCSSNADCASGDECAPAPDQPVTCGM